MATNPSPSKLNSAQIAQRAFQESDDRIRVSADITLGPVTQEVVIDHENDSIRIGDSVDLVTTTTVDGDVGLDVNIIAGSMTGEFTLTGLHIGGRNTTMNVTATATLIPAVAFASRNSITVTNLSLVDTIYIGFDSSVTADSVVGTTSGFPVSPQAGFNLDITTTVPLYAIAESGKTVKIIITELA